VTILEAVVGFLRDDGWAIEDQPDDLPVVRTAVRTGESEWPCAALAREDERQLIFYSLYPSPVPAARRGAVMELLTLANYGLFVGAFEMDLADGELRFRTSVVVEDDADPGPSMIRPVVYANVMAMDRYLPAIRDVCERGADPAAAVTKVE
jgi:hypothetical protein